MILIECNQCFYELKFGTNCLIYLDEFLHISDIEEKERKLFGLLIIKSGFNYLSFDEKQRLFETLKREKGIKYIQELMDKIQIDSFGEYKTINQIVYEDLLSKAIGEVGISKQDFDMLSPHEVDLIYKGYIQKKQLEANCSLIALRKSKDNNANLICLIGGDGYAQSTLTERQDTFNTLGI